MKTWICKLFLMSFVFSFAVSNAQQVIGTYPAMNGGFEGISDSAITVQSSVNSTSTIWTTVGSGSSGIFVTGGGRTGQVYADVTQTGTTHKRVLQSLTAETGYAGAGIYTIQFYYRGDNEGVVPDHRYTLCRKTSQWNLWSRHYLYFSIHSKPPGSQLD